MEEDKIETGIARKKLLDIAADLKSGNKSMIDLKVLLEEIHANTSDPELLAIIWVLEHLTEELNCHFGEGLNIKTDCAKQFETHWQNLSESVGDYITNIIGESYRSHSMADMILALYQLYDFAAQAIEN